MAYDTEVNKGSINMGHLARHLNDRQSKGWRLDHIFEQDGNTVLIFEKDERVDQIISLLGDIRAALAAQSGDVQPPAFQTAPAAPATPASTLMPSGWDTPDAPKRRFSR
jgi:hypothetical protein